MKNKFKRVFAGLISVLALETLIPWNQAIVPQFTTIAVSAEELNPTDEYSMQFGDFTITGEYQYFTDLARAIGWDDTNGVLTIHCGIFSVSTMNETTNRIVIDGDSEVILKGVNIVCVNENASPISVIAGSDEITKSAKVTLEGENTLIGGKYAPGIFADKDNTVTITEASTGKLTAKGGICAPGIGAKYGLDGGNIVISGGNITSSAVSGATAAIGSAYNNNGKAQGFTMTGGTVHAIPTPGFKDVNSSAVRVDGDIVISGGIFVSEYSNLQSHGSGIAGKLITTDSGNAIVWTKFGCYMGNSIDDTSNKDEWHGIIIEGYTDAKVYGDEVTLPDDFTIESDVNEFGSDVTLEIPEGSTLIIPEGVTLTNNSTIINNGTLVINGTLENNSTFTNSGVITKRGTIIDNTIEDGITPILDVSITDIYAPEAMGSLDTSCVCSTDGIESISMDWSPSSDIAEYNTEYSLNITLTEKEGYSFSNLTTASINGDNAKVTKSDNALIVSYIFPKTDVKPNTVNFAGYEWYVIGDENGGIYSSDDSLTLLLKTQDSPFGTTTYGYGYPQYGLSYLKSRMNEIVSQFSANEQNLINPRTLDDVNGGSVDNQKLWPLSRNEIESIECKSIKIYSDEYFLRTVKEDNTIPRILAVHKNGGINYGIYYYSDLKRSLRPALSLNLADELFSTSLDKDAVNKASVSAGGKFISLTDGTVSKYTMKSEDQSISLLVSEEAANQSGAELEFYCSDSTTGTNEYISCTLTDEDTMYYTKLSDASESTAGKIVVPVSGVENGTYTLSIFAEQINEDLYTDFASEPVTMTVTVLNGVGTVSNYEGEIHTHSVYENGFCTECDAFEIPVLNDNNTDDASDDFYEIANAGNLYWFAERVNNGNTSINAKLTDDIIVNEGKMNADIDVSSVRLWTPIGKSYDIEYNGIFDGNTHSIKGLYYVSSQINENDYMDYYKTAGLFGNCYNADIKNLTLENSCFNFNADSNFGHIYFGGIVGRSRNSNFTNIASDVSAFSSQNVRVYGNDYYYGNNIIGCYDISTLDDNPIGHGGNGMYYLISDDSEDTNEYAKKLSQFQSGEVAYLLGECWGQEIGVDEYPVLGGMKVYSGYVNCLDENISYSNEESVLRQSSDHVYGTWRVTTKPNCTEEGVITRYCKYCDDSQTISFDELGHKYSYVSLENGMHQVTCSRCGVEFTEACTYDEDGICICGTNITDIVDLIAKEPYATVSGGKNRVVFAFERNVPESYTVVENGVLYNNNGDITKENAADQLVLNGENVKIGRNSSNANSGSYTAKISNTDDNEVYARGYMIVSDADGYQLIIYTEIIYGNYSDLNSSIQ